MRKIAIQRVNYEGKIYSETLTRTNLFCVFCGLHGLWDQCTQDYYHGTTYICQGCGSNFSYSDWENEKDLEEFQEKVTAALDNKGSV